MHAKIGPGLVRTPAHEHWTAASAAGLRVVNKNSAGRAPSKHLQSITHGELACTLCLQTTIVNHVRALIETFPCQSN